MKKRILGLDLGTNSIGWALVNKAENENEKSEIIKLGVRVNPLTTDEKSDFEKGNPISTNANRTLKRGARRNLQRFKLRRENLIEILLKLKFITKDTPLVETGEKSTYQTLKIRAKAAREQIELHDLARVFLVINKKRGYKSSRKSKNEEEGQAIDGMQVAKALYDKNLTPGEYAFNLLKEGKKYIPDFYRSDLQLEFNKVWDWQKQYYKTYLTDELYEKLQEKNKTQTWAICKEPFNLEGIKLQEKGGELKKKKYELRSMALSKKLDFEHLAIVFQEINNDLNKSSGYLGNISDRSKELYFNKVTVGEYLWKQIEENPHTSLKNQVFYRQDYLDEFEQIWETQSKFYPQMTDKLKEEIRDIVIFYQRKLKSQKGLLSFCQFESKEIDKTDEKENVIINKQTGLPQKQTIGRRVIPKSSPLFQEFKIWQNLNGVIFENETKNEIITVNELDDEIRFDLFAELNLHKEQSFKQVLKLLSKYLQIGKISEWKCNFTKIEGNRTNAELYNIYHKILEIEGYGFNWDKKSAKEKLEEVRTVFAEIGINTDVLNFNAEAESDFDKQKSYQLWHLLYSAEDDNNKISEEDKIIYGSSAVKLKKLLVEKYGFKVEYAKMLANLSFDKDYGNLSSKAIRKIIPYLREGNLYSEACSLAGYNHSSSLTKEENEKRELADKLDLLPKNSLRNPVVEKILNQMVNVVNQIIECYGRPDEIHVELARELKKNSDERDKATKNINSATNRNIKIKELLSREFNIPNPTKNDVVRYRLWEELSVIGYKDVFTGKQIKKEQLFSKLIDIEHIIPKALVFDDSFSNKTLAFKKDNLKKSDRTAIDFISQDYSDRVEDFKGRVQKLFNNDNGTISKTKRNKLLMSLKDIPDGFIERDLRNSQYIAKKAKDMLQALVKNNIVSTSGSITDKLRKDWGLINVMKELNMPKYRDLGLTEFEQRLNKETGELVSYEVITNWTKRNDHRHHAMDALTVAFTSHNHIQYLNYLHAKEDKTHKHHENIIKISQKIRKNSLFIPPMDNFREEAKKHIGDILISIKAKNKVVTKNKNYISSKKVPQETLTPRSQLHNETIYGKSKQLMSKSIKLNKKTELKQVELIANQELKDIVKQHLIKFDNKPEKAFDSKILKSNPIVYKDKIVREVSCFEEVFTIRKCISPDLRLEKIVDKGVKETLYNRLAEFNNDPKEAFSNLDTNPIWLNKEKGISIKRVTIKGVNNTEALHHKKDHLGNFILNSNGQKQPVDFVSTGNNHHVAIYHDKKGELKEKVVSFYEAVERACQKQPIIGKEYNKEKGWEFMFTMKQNEMFVFPNNDFDINEIDLLDENNASLISKHLFRVQKIATKIIFLDII